MAALRCKAVLFDLDDTLVATTRIDRLAVDSAARLAASRAEGLVAEDVAKAFVVGLATTPFPPVTAPRPSVEEWRTALWAKALGVDEGGDASLPRDIFLHWMDQRLGRFTFEPSVAGLVRELRSQGYLLGMVTNGPAEVQRPKLQACGAKDLFGDMVVVSGEQPHAKPHASIFHTACTLIGSRPSETVMVGDSIAADVQGSVNAGLLASIWVTGEGDLRKPPPREGEPQPTFTVRSVADVGKVLRQIG